MVLVMTMRKGMLTVVAEAVVICLDILLLTTQVSPSSPYVDCHHRLLTTILCMFLCILSMKK